MGANETCNGCQCARVHTAVNDAGYRDVPAILGKLRSDQWNRWVCLFRVARVTMALSSIAPSALLQHAV